jgi:leucyl-tRNA synthetase
MVNVGGTMRQMIHLVEKKEVKQWFFKITAYADDLLEATDALDWSDVVKTAQKNWIGRSVGAEVTFAVDPNSEVTRLQYLRPVQIRCLVRHSWLLPRSMNLYLSLTTDENAEKVHEYVKKFTQKD